MDKGRPSAKRIKRDLSGTQVDSSKQEQCPNKEDPTKIDVVCHELKYRAPYYFSESLSKLSVEERIKKIVEFHTLMHKKIYEAQRKSINLVPWGKPITTVSREKFNGSLLRQSELESEEAEDEQKEEKKEEKSEIYISHSGRQTKRKVYSEEALDVLSLTSKKARSLQTPNKPKSKKMTNDEIIASSSLFRDPPKTYTDKIFNKLVDENNKRQEVDDQLEKCQESFCDYEFVDEDLPEEGEFDEKNENDEDFKPRRVPPPNPYKKKQNRGTASGGSQELQVSQNSGNKGRSASVDSSNLKPSNNKGKKECPICSKYFTSDKLAKHASTCGEILESPEKHSPDFKQLVETTCHKCDTTFVSNEEFQQHTFECVRSNTNTKL